MSYSFLPLGKLDTKEAEASACLWGNKARNLAILYQCGIPVPPAYVYPALSISQMPWYQLWGILDEFGQVAVRSSGRYSMPGMMKTKLGVKNSLGIISAVIEVKASAFSECCLEYKKLKGIPQQLETAVIIQKFFPADNKMSCAGVCETADSLTGEHNIVGGFARNVADNMYVVQDGYGMESIWRMPRRWLHQLQDAALYIESIFQYPQDIEFLIINGELWIVQTRDLVFGKGDY